MFGLGSFRETLGISPCEDFHIIKGGLMGSPHLRSKGLTVDPMLGNAKKTTNDERDGLWAV